MKIAVISDIHGNLEAFEKVLSDISRADVDTIVCLGDNIGYGPNSEEVVTLIRDLGIVTVMGNHEMGVVDSANLDWFNPTARQSLEMTIPQLGEDTINFIQNLNESFVYRGCCFVHGFPPDSVNDYLFQVTDAEIQALFHQIEPRLCFIGHTHKLEMVRVQKNKVTRTPLEQGVTKLKKNSQYICNVGSVGQPRDGNNNAKYVIWNISAQSIETRYVPYDIAAVVEKMTKGKWPRVHADRLW